MATFWATCEKMDHFFILTFGHTVDYGIVLK